MPISRLLEVRAQLRLVCLVAPLALHNAGGLPRLAGHRGGRRRRRGGLDLLSDTAHIKRRHRAWALPHFLLLPRRLSLAAPRRLAPLYLQVRAAPGGVRLREVAGRSRAWRRRRVSRPEGLPARAGSLTNRLVPEAELVVNGPFRWPFHSSLKSSTLLLVPHAGADHGGSMAVDVVLRPD